MKGAHPLYRGGVCVLEGDVVLCGQEPEVTVELKHMISSSL